MTAATLLGGLLVAVPVLCLAAAVVVTEGWGALAIVVGALVGALAVSGVITFGIYLITEGWPA